MESEQKKPAARRLVKLFFSMLYISAFTFGGGFVIVTLMKRKFVDELHWMTEDVGWEFAERMAVEFHRSYENDEIDEKLFSLEERSNLYILAKDPGYVKRFYLGKVVLDKRVYDCKNKVNDLEKVVAEKDRMMQAQRKSYEQRLAKKQAEHEKMCSRLEQQRLLELEQQKQKYESSVTFKAGRVIMFIPSGIKRLVFRMMKKE